MRTGTAARSRRAERGLRSAATSLVAAWRVTASLLGAPIAAASSRGPRVVVRRGAKDAHEQREAGDDRGDAEKQCDTYGAKRGSSVHRTLLEIWLASSHRRRSPGTEAATAGARPRPIADRSPDRDIGASVRAIGARDCGCPDGPQTRCHVDGTPFLSQLRPPLPALPEQRERPRGRLLRARRAALRAAGAPRSLPAARSHLPARDHGLRLHRAAAVRGRWRLRGKRRLPSGPPAYQPRLPAPQRSPARRGYRVRPAGGMGPTRA